MKEQSILDQPINMMLAQKLMIQAISAEPLLGQTECFGGERNCLLIKQVCRVFLIFSFLLFLSSWTIQDLSGGEFSKVAKEEVEA